VAGQGAIRAGPAVSLLPPWRSFERVLANSRSTSLVFTLGLQPEGVQMRRTENGLQKTREDLAAAIVAEASINQGEAVPAYPYSSGCSRSPPVAHTCPCREGFPFADTAGRRGGLAQTAATWMPSVVTQPVAFEKLHSKEEAESRPKKYWKVPRDLPVFRRRTRWRSRVSWRSSQGRMLIQEAGGLSFFLRRSRNPRPRNLCPV
jgi:hypothetical protein